jgi:DNA-binding MarR family transcriptional regulator
MTDADLNAESGPETAAVDTAGPSSALDLGNYVPYLLNRAGARIAAAFTAIVREQGITLPMWRVLAVLRDDGPSRIGHLSERTSIEVSTLSRVVDGLEQRGLARRRREERDARSVRVGLTEAGAALTDRLIPVAREYELIATAGLTPGEIDLLKALLRRVYANMAALD